MDLRILVPGFVVALLGCPEPQRVPDRPLSPSATDVRSALATIRQAIESYAVENGQYPTTEQGLMALVMPPLLDPKPMNWRKYLTHMPRDPWGRGYVYRYENRVVLLSLGPDGLEGTADDIQH